jgi:hypothetical protein
MNTDARALLSWVENSRAGVRVINVNGLLRFHVI